MTPMTLVQQDYTRFLTPEGLAEKCGVPLDMFRCMILKELTDNTLDTLTPVEITPLDPSQVTISDLEFGVVHCR